MTGRTQQPAYALHVVVSLLDRLVTVQALQRAQNSERLAAMAADRGFGREVVVT